MAAVVCVTVAIGAGPLSGEWQHWRYSREIEAPSTAAVRFVKLVLPQDVYLHADNSLADIRVIDDAGQEVPYTQFTRDSVALPAVFPAQVIEDSFSPGNYTQLVLDLSPYTEFHDAAEIGVGQDEVMEWVQVEASDDARVWRIVQERAPIFRFAREGRQGNQRVAYSENNARYLRIRILDGDKQFPVQSVRIFAKPTVPPAPERVALPIEMTPTKADVLDASAWSVDLQRPQVPVREVRFEVGPGEFVREVRIQSSRDAKMWGPQASGEIFRFSQDGHECEQLSVSTGAPQRYVRVEILNGNDAPLRTTPKLYVTPEQLVFEQEPGKNYRLIYGDPAAKAPLYDLRRRVSFQQMNASVEAQTGSEDVNSAWTDPRPWSETHEVVVWFGVAAAILLLAFTAIQSLRTQGGGSAERAD